MLQILFGLLMVICGLIAIAIRESDGSAGTPYFIFAFVSGILVCIAHFTHPYFHSFAALSMTRKCPNPKKAYCKLEFFCEGFIFAKLRDAEFVLYRCSRK